MSQSVTPSSGGEQGAVAPAAPLPISVALFADADVMLRFGSWLRYLQLTLADELIPTAFVMPRDVEAENWVTSTSTQLRIDRSRWMTETRTVGHLLEPMREALRVNQPRHVIFHTFTPDMLPLLGLLSGQINSTTAGTVSQVSDIDHLHGPLVGKAHMMVTSERLRSMLVARHPDAAVRARVIRLGIAADERAQWMDTPEERLVFLCTGPLKSETAALGLLSAVSAAVDRGHDVMIFFVSVGPLEGALRRQTQAWGLASRVVIVDEIDVTQALRGAHVWCLPDMVTTCRIRNLRAIRAGLVTLTPTGGVLDAAIDGRTAYCFKPDDPAHIRETVLRIVEQRDEAAKVAAAGVKWVREQHKLSASLTQVISWYRTISAKAAAQAAAPPPPAPAESDSTSSK